MRLLMLGAPGSGKGTQSEKLRIDYQIPQLSTGDMLRQAVAADTELGRQAKVYMESGALVPDAVIIGLMKDRIAHDDCKKGYILDGFPRTTAQAEALDVMLKSVGSTLDLVCEIVVPEAVVLERLAGRWLCKSCGASYHASFRPPQHTGVCDKCQGPLYQRPDDTHETAVRRLEVYRQETLPLVGYYQNQGILQQIDGTGSVDAITDRLRAIIGQVPRA